MAAQPKGAEYGEWEERLLGLLGEPELAGEADDGLEESGQGPSGGVEVVAPGGAEQVDPGESKQVRAALVALQGLGMDEASAARWVGLLCAQLSADGTEAEGVPAPDSDAEVLDAMGAISHSGAALEACLLVWVQDLVLRTGSRLLAERGVEDPRSMSKTAHQTWRVTVKASVAGELQVRLGVSIWEARQLVAIATSPGMVRIPLLGALRRGEVTRRLVIAFQTATRRLEVGQAGRVSEAMFGTDPDRAAVERLDVDGQLDLGRPWHHPEFHAALKREVTRVKSPEDAEEDRRAAHESRNARLDVEDDGTATLTCTMATVTAVAVQGRIENMARRARAGGDPRTLAQLRSDIVAVLLLHGIVTLPGDRPCGCATPQEASASAATTSTGVGTGPDEFQPGCACACAGGGAGAEGLFDEVITPEDVEALRAIITATPAGRVDLVIPWDAALGAVCPHCRGPSIGRGDNARGDRYADTGPGDRFSDAQGGMHADTGLGDRLSDGQGDRYVDSGPGDSSVDPPSDLDAPHSGCAPSAACRRQAPHWLDDGRGAVGELIGWESAFITPRQARAIMLTPGSVVGRLLTDPADGRCIERSVKRHDPDADMKRQVRAADVYGRGPGCRRPAAQCELDHEKEWLAHGWTAEANLNAKALLDHARKTKKLWRSIMNRRRDVTWTTLLGQVARTRGHDYRQYLDRVRSLAPHDPIDQPDVERAPEDRSDLAARRDLMNQFLYAAIVHRRPGERAEADDDVFGSEDWLMIGDWGHVHHTDPDGRRRPGPPPSHPTPEELLGLDGAGEESSDERGEGQQGPGEQGEGQQGPGEQGEGRWGEGQWGDGARPDDPPPF